MDRRVRHHVLPWMVPALFLATWIVASGTGLVPRYLLPHPLGVAKAGWRYVFGVGSRGAFAGRFAVDAASSILRVACGFGAAALLGLTLGVISGRMATVHSMLSNTVHGLRAVPGIAWYPLAFVWFGIGMRTAVFLIALAAFFPVYLNTTAGVRQVNVRWLQAGAMMGMGRIAGTFTILMPAAMPQIMAGLRLGLGIAWAYVVLGELFGVSHGLGAAIWEARMHGRVDVIVVAMILISGLGRASDAVLVFAMRRLFKSARRMA